MEAGEPPPQQQQWRLVAVSKRALEFRPDGAASADIPLSAGRKTSVGRAPENDVRLPASWVQISSRHAEFNWSEEEVRGRAG